MGLYTRMFMQSLWISNFGNINAVFHNNEFAQIVMGHPQKNVMMSLKLMFPKNMKNTYKTVLSK